MHTAANCAVDIDTGTATAPSKQSRTWGVTSSGDSTYGPDPARRQHGKAPDPTDANRTRTA